MVNLHVSSAHRQRLDVRLAIVEAMERKEDSLRVSGGDTDCEPTRDGCSPHGLQLNELVLRKGRS